MKKLFLLSVLFFAFSAKAQLITQYTTATSGTVTASNTQQDIFLIQDATLSGAMTFAFPANPVDGQSITFVSVGGVTIATLTAAVGTIVNALTGMTAGSPATYRYYQPTNKWYRSR